MRVNIISAVLMMIVSEGLLFNANSAISQQEQVNFQWDDDEVRIVLDQHAELDFKVLAHWNNSPRVDMLLLLDTLFWYEPTSLCSFSLILLVWDSSAVRRLFVRLAGAVECQSTLHKENSRFASPTPGRHIFMFRGYQILFSIQNPYINRFTNHFSIHS